MFSRRLPWPVPVNRLSRLLDEKRARGARILDLTESNPTRVGLPSPAAAIAEALADPGTAVYDPSPRGCPAARRAVAADYARRGHAVPPDAVLLTAGTSEAYGLLFKMLADPGDTILVPRPGYPLFDFLAALESVRVAPYPLVHDDWGIDLPALERRAAAGDPPPKAIVVVNPNNPTGSGLRPAERIALAEIATGRDMAIISDEVFFDYLFTRDGAPAVEMSGTAAADGVVSMLGPYPGGGPGPLRFTLGGLSKSCGLPQMKLGWIVAEGPGGAVAEALDRLELIADTYLSVGTPVQRAAPRLLEIGKVIRRSIIERLLQNRRAIAARIRPGSSCRLLEADGGWYAVLQVPAILSEEELILRLLAEDETLVHPGYFFDFPREAYLILSLLPEPGIVREGVERILARVGGG